MTFITERVRFTFRPRAAYQLCTLCTLTALLVLYTRDFEADSQPCHETETSQRSPTYRENHQPHHEIKDAARLNDSPLMSYESSSNHDEGSWVSWNNTQTSRVRRVRRVCSGYQNTQISLDTMLKQSKLFRDAVVVDQKHHVIYCAIPKAACSSWRSAIAILTGKVDRNDSHTLHYVHNLAFMSSIGIIPLSKYIRIKGADSSAVNLFHKLIVVRHPFERLVSAFRDKFETYNKWTKHFQMTYGRDIIARYRQSASEKSLATGHDVRFTEFVQWILDPSVDDNFKLNPHWARFFDLCQPCLMDYDHIINFNSFQQDTYAILERIFNVTDPETFFPYRNVKSVNTKDIEADYIGLLSELQISRLYKFYEKDFDLFNYTWPR